MSDLAVAPEQPSRQAIQAKTASKPLRVTGKLADAIDLMIETGALWDEAAVKAGLHVRTMRLAMQRPHVIAHLKARREVFRVNASAGNIHRLAQLARQDDNKAAAVTAIKALEQIGESEAQSGGRQSLPGMQIVIVQAGSQPQHVVLEHDPQPASHTGNQPSD